MKMKISLSILALTIGLAFSACKKHTEGKTTYQTVDVTVDMNKAYQYNFGSGKSHLSITKQSQAFLVSEIDNTNDEAVLNYMPKTNFTGTDVIEVSSCAGHGNHHDANAGTPPQNGNCQHACGNQYCNHSHNCTGHHDCAHHDKTVYTFRFTVKSTTPATITKISSLSSTANQQ